MIKPDRFGVSRAIVVIGVLTVDSGAVVLARMYETLPSRRASR